MVIIPNSLLDRTESISNPECHFVHKFVDGHLPKFWLGETNPECPRFALSDHLMCDVLPARSTATSQVSFNITRGLQAG